MPAPTSEALTLSATKLLRSRLRPALQPRDGHGPKPILNSPDGGEREAGADLPAPYPMLPPLLVYDGSRNTKRVLTERLRQVHRSQLAGTAVLVLTSGSTGTPSLVALSPQAIVSSARATHARLGGPGTWVAALPFQHVAGLQVLARSVVAGTEPLLASNLTERSASFDVDQFVDLTERARPDARRLYTSLVTKMATDLLDTSAGVRALQSYDAILVGGGPVSTDLRRRAEKSGVNLVTTYGMTETAGGCVYDGLPLDGTSLRIDPTSSQILLSGPTLMNGYMGEPAPWIVDEDGTRWFQTSDLGRIDGGQLRVLGRTDDIVNSGGHKVSTRLVEKAIRQTPAVADVHVFGVPDETWGERVAAAVELVEPGLAGTAPPEQTESLNDLAASIRSSVLADLPAHCVPRTVFVLQEVPRTDLGKVDGNAIRQQLATAISQNRAWQR